MYAHTDKNKDKKISHSPLKILSAITIKNVLKIIQREDRRYLLKQLLSHKQAFIIDLDNMRISLGHTCTKEVMLNIYIASFRLHYVFKHAFLYYFLLFYDSNCTSLLKLEVYAAKLSIQRSVIIQKAFSMSKAWNWKKKCIKYSHLLSFLRTIAWSKRQTAWD